MGMFSKLFGNPERKNPEIGRENLGGKLFANPENPETGPDTSAADMTPEKIEAMIEEEQAESIPDIERIKKLSRLLENKQ